MCDRQPPRSLYRQWETQHLLYMAAGTIVVTILHAVCDRLSIFWSKVLIVNNQYCSTPHISIFKTRCQSRTPNKLLPARVCLVKNALHEIIPACQCVTLLLAAPALPPQEAAVTIYGEHKDNLFVHCIESFHSSRLCGLFFPFVHKKRAFVTQRVLQKAVNLFS